MASITLSYPLPLSSHTPHLCINPAIFSFLEIGTVSTTLSTGTNGAPKLENSILFSNNSIIGLVPV